MLVFLQSFMQYIFQEHGVIPRVDEISEIIESAGCQNEDDKQCTEFVTGCAETKANEILKNLRSLGESPTKSGVAVYVHAILHECGFNHDRYTDRGKIVTPPVTVPAPHPVFHCNSYQGQDEVVHINFRMDYRENETWEGVSKDRIPRYFVIETRHEGKWVLATKPVQAYWLFPFSTEANTQFQVRVTAVSPKYVYPPATSAVVPVFSSSMLDLTRPPVLEKVNVFVDETASRPSPSAFMRWRSGSGQNASCDWDVYYMYEEQKKVERKTSGDTFWAVLHGLEFERNYSVMIHEKFGVGLELQTNVTLHVPSCTEIRKENAGLCLPRRPIKLRLVNATDHSFWAAWDPPTHTKTIAGLQYNVTVEWIFSVHPIASPAVDGRVQGTTSGLGPSADTPQNMVTSYTTQLLFNDIVPGNVTAIQIHNMTQVRGQIKISVVAVGPGGVSAPAWKIVTYQGAKRNPWSIQKISLIIFAPCLVVTLMLLIGVSKHMQGRRQRKRKRRQTFENYEKDCLEMQQFNDKDFSKWDIDWCNLTLREPIGQGNFGQVRRGILNQNGKKKVVAVKTLRDGVDKKEVEKLWEEYEILKNLDPHVHVVGLKGIVTKYVPQPLLVVEYCDGGSLLLFLRGLIQTSGTTRRQSHAGSMISGSGNSSYSMGSHGEPSPSPTATNLAYFLRNEGELPQGCPALPPPLTMGNLLSFSRQVSVGMEYLSNNKIVHRDLAARNVLICGKRRILKIADFGLSRDVYEQNLYKQTSKGDIPVKWLAKESLLNGIYTTKSDVWSFGILLWEIFTIGGNPYPGVDNATVFQLLKDNYRMSRPDACPEQVYQLMSSCWQDDPSARPDFTECRHMLENIIQEITQVTYLNFEPNSKSLKEPHYKHPDSGFGHQEGSGSSESEVAPELPPRNKKATG